MQWMINWKNKFKIFNLNLMKWKVKILGNKMFLKKIWIY